MELYNNIKEYLMIVYHLNLNLFDDKYQFLILHVQVFQQEILIDYDDQSK
jgi:hypothetical protein